MPERIRTLLANAFGLCSKFGELQSTLKQLRIDVAIITETKFTLSKFSLAESTVPGYHPPLRLDHTAQGGGVAAWIREDLAYELLDNIPNDDHEVVWFSLCRQKGAKLVFCAVYRSGSCSPHDVSLFEYLDRTLEHLHSPNTNIVLAGDLNVHHEDWLGSTKTTPAGEAAEELCALHCLSQHVTEPTRGENLLDLVLSDLPEDAVTTEVKDPLSSSDHASVLTWQSQRS